MQSKEFTKHTRDSKYGFSRAEATVKQAEVNAEYDVDNPTSTWNRAVIVPDASKVKGYKVVITTKE